MLKLSAQQALLAAPFCAVEDVRFYLKGILVEPHEDGGAVLVATNGHIAICVRDAAAEVEDVPVIVSPTKDALAHLSRSKTGKLVVNDDPVRRQLSVTTTAGEVKFIQPEPAIVDAKFPDWRRIIPAESDLMPGRLGSFSTEYIDLVHSVLAKRHTYVRWWGTQSIDTCAVFRATGPAIDAFGIVMPARTDLTTPLPKWLALPDAEQKAAA